MRQVKNDMDDYDVFDQWRHLVNELEVGLYFVILSGLQLDCPSFLRTRAESIMHCIHPI